jgi:L-threonylcarbamoyladenylate synthase
MSVFEPNRKTIREAVSAIKDGNIVAYPTETFYGLGVDPCNEEAIDKLYRLKGWKEKRPVSVLVNHLDKLTPLVKEIPPIATLLMNTFWPGPLTLVFKINPSFPPLISGGTDKIGARISSNEIANKLLEELDGPLTTTSANLTGGKEAFSAEDVEAFFGRNVSIILQGGELKGIKGSTIIDVTGDEFEVIREGDLPLNMIKTICR